MRTNKFRLTKESNFSSEIVGIWLEVDNTHMFLHTRYIYIYLNAEYNHGKIHKIYKVKLKIK